MDGKLWAWSSLPRSSGKDGQKNAASKLLASHPQKLERLKYKQFSKVAVGEGFIVAISLDQPAQKAHDQKARKAKKPSYATV